MDIACGVHRRLDDRQVAHDLPDDLERLHLQLLMEFRDQIERVERFCRPSSSGRGLMGGAVLSEFHHTAA